MKVMKKSEITSKSVDAYIARAPGVAQAKLHELRALIRVLAPEAAEKIGYGIPTFTLNGNLVHFGGYEEHIGFYPGAEAIQVFAEDLKKYNTSRGTVQFPLDKPLPKTLIKKIVKYRIQVQSRKT